MLSARLKKGVIMKIYVIPKVEDWEERIKKDMRQGVWTWDIVREFFRHTEVMYIESWKITPNDLTYLSRYFNIQAIVDSTSAYFSELGYVVRG